MAFCRITSLLTAVALATVAGSAVADLKPEDQIKYRQAGYSFMSWNMGQIKANLEGEFDAGRVQAAANSIAGIANSGMGALYGPDTGQDIGDVKTRLKPEFFQNQDDVREIAVGFITAANAMAEAAATEDRDAVQRAFGNLGQACKACHDKYRAD